jgi:hypothetical protein
VDLVASNHVDLIPTGPTGQPLFNKCLVVVEANSHAAIQSLTGVNVFPDFPLDSKVTSMHTPTRQAMAAMLLSRGFSTDFLNGADGFRDVIREVGRQLDPAFNEVHFEVSGS